MVFDGAVAEPKLPLIQAARLSGLWQGSEPRLSTLSFTTNQQPNQ